jgi:hypothetical protein
VARIALKEQPNLRYLEHRSLASLVGIIDELQPPEVPIHSIFSPFLREDFGVGCFSKFRNGWTDKKRASGLPEPRCVEFDPWLL